jgi:outer membrane protein assembly factor BamE (lipoprotein component of BamABCDE complex)
MRRIVIIIALFIVIAFIAGCAKQPPQTANDRELTVGLVQRDIKVGMSQADVAEALGSPNIVTKDSDEKETWIYDKIASSASYSQHGGYWTLVLVGGSWGSGRSESSQRTLTVVIKFDKAGRVHKVTYHSTKF